MPDLFSDTLRSLRAHALRFGLTSLGIVWGAFLLTYLSASMEGVDEHFTREMEEAGPRIVVASAGEVFKERVGQRGAREVELDREDVARVETLQSVETASPDLTLWSQLVRAGGRTKLLNVNGLDAGSQALRNLSVREGRFLSPLDVRRGARVAYLGAVAAERLFGGRPAVGRTLQVESISFRVIGVGEAKDDQMVGINGWDDWTVFVPYTAAQRWLLRDDDVPKFSFSPVTREKSWEAIRQSRELLALHHDFQPDLDTAVTFFNIQDVLKLLNTILLGLRAFQLSAGVITLLVGAVGVMNIMLVVVGERTAEIGLRKAVGATSRDVFLQFLAEAAAVCGLSGLLGALLGVGFTQLVASWSPPEGPLSSPPVLDPYTVAVVTLSLVGVGVVAGVVPALCAARIPPAEALRAV